VNQDRLFQALKRFPNFLELSIRKRGMLVVANWDVLDAESVLPVVRNQIHVKLCVESQLLFVKQVDNRCFCLFRMLSSAALLNSLVDRNTSVIFVVL